MAISPKSFIFANCLFYHLITTNLNITTNMKETKPIKIFVSSSSNGLEDERKELKKYIENTISNNLNTKFEVYIWEDELSKISNQETIQSRISPELGISDLVIFLFFDRLGDHTKEEFMLTQEQEINRLIFIKKINAECIRGDENYQRYNELRSFLGTIDNNVDFKNEFDNINDLLFQVWEEFSKKFEPFQFHTFDSEEFEIKSLPPYNNQFHGREREQEKLATAVQKTTITAIQGMGGAGKTSLAAKFCKESGLFKKVVWINFQNDFIHSLSSLNTQRNNDEILTYLKSFGKELLLVVDNIDIPIKDINDQLELIETKLPLAKILITTRTRLDDLTEKVYVLNLGPMNHEDSKQLFLNHYGRIIDDKTKQVTLKELDDFLYRVDNHALYVVFIAKLLRENNILLKMSDIIAHLSGEKPIKTALSSHLPNYHHSDLEITTLTETLFSTSNLSEDEKELMQFCAIVCESGIEMEALYHVYAAEDVGIFQMTINKLCANGWLEQDDYTGRIRCHRLIALAVLGKEMIIDSAQINNALKVLKNVTLDVSDTDQSYFVVQMSLLAFMKQKWQSIKNNECIDEVLFAENAVNFANFSMLHERAEAIRGKQIEEYLAYSIIDFSLKHIEKSSLQCAKLYECLGKFYNGCFRYKEAESFFTQALDNEDKYQNGNVKEKATTLGALSDMYSNQGKYTKAVIAAYQAYTINEGLFHKDCLENIEICQSLAKLCLDLGYEEDCKEWQKRIDSIIERHGLTENSTMKINRLLLKARLIHNNLSKALTIIKEAESIVIKKFGLISPMMGDVHLARHEIYVDEGFYRKARDEYGKYVGINHSCFGFTDADEYILQYYDYLTAHALGNSLKKKLIVKQLESASPYDNKEYATSVRTCVCYLLCWYYSEQGDFSKSDIYAEKGLDIIRQELNVRNNERVYLKAVLHGRTTLPSSCYGMDYYYVFSERLILNCILKDDRGKARKICQDLINHSQNDSDLNKTRSLKMILDLLDEKDLKAHFYRELQYSKQNQKFYKAREIAELYETIEKADEACTYYDICLQSNVRVYANNRDLVSVLQDRGKLERDSKEKNKLFQEAIRRSKANEELDRDQFVILNELLALSLMQMEEYKDAEDVFERAIAEWEQDGDKDEFLSYLYSMLGLCQYYQEKDDQALSSAEKSLKYYPDLNDSLAFDLFYNCAVYTKGKDDKYDFYKYYFNKAESLADTTEKEELLNQLSIDL